MVLDRIYKFFLKIDSFFFLKIVFLLRIVVVWRLVKTVFKGLEFYLKEQDIWQGLNKTKGKEEISN